MSQKQTQVREPGLTPRPLDPAKPWLRQTMTTLDGRAAHPGCGPLRSASHRSLEQAAFLGNGLEDWQDLSQRWWAGVEVWAEGRAAMYLSLKKGKNFLLLGVLEPPQASHAYSSPKDQKPPPFSGCLGFLLLCLQTSPLTWLREPLVHSPGHWEQTAGSRWL